MLPPTVAHRVTHRATLARRSTASPPLNAPTPATASAVAHSMSANHRSRLGAYETTRPLPAAFLASLARCPALTRETGYVTRPAATGSTRCPPHIRRPLPVSPISVDSTSPVPRNSVTRRL